MSTSSTTAGHTIGWVTKYIHQYELGLGDNIYGQNQIFNNQYFWPDTSILILQKYCIGVFTKYLHNDMFDKESSVVMTK